MYKVWGSRSCVGLGIGQEASAKWSVRHYREALFLRVGRFVSNPSLSHEIFGRIAQLHQCKIASSMLVPKAITQLRVSYCVANPK